MTDVWDTVVIGSGAGGLGCALHLAERGVKVLLVEALTYPGGCAGTFSHHGISHDAGATLLSPMGPDNWLPRWLRVHGVELPMHRPDPAVAFRAPGVDVQVPGSRGAWVERLCALPGAPTEAIRRFFDVQAKVADLLWPVLDDPELLPPLSGRALGGNLPRVLAAPTLLPLLGRPLLSVVERTGVAGFPPLRMWLDAMCQISVQTSAAEAEAPFALAALDYYFRSPGHPVGGVGALPLAMVRAFEESGGTMRYAARVRGLQREEDGTWVVDARGKPERARTVVANLLPGALEKLLGRSTSRLEKLSADVHSGWGAAMWYLQGRWEGPSVPHWQLIEQADQPLHSGNHVFVSMGSPDEDGLRKVTASSHVPMQTPPDGPSIEAIQGRMRSLMQQRLPELQIVGGYSASPRTFQRFTGRPGGFVGGVPRWHGLHNYRGLWPRPIERGLYLTGDTMFPGQSFTAAALGGHRVAEALLRKL